MARKIDKKSTRQKAYTYLGKQLSKPRGEVIPTLMTKFDIERPYAMTLYQSHRADMIEAGTLKEVFTVRDTKEGASVTPFITSTHVVKPGKSDSTTEAQAKKAYTANLQARIKAVAKLK